MAGQVVLCSDLETHTRATRWVHHASWPPPLLQLLRAQPAVEADRTGTQPSLAGLTAAAERVARAGLRLDGASADLWAALGAVAAEVRWEAQMWHMLVWFAGMLAVRILTLSRNPVAALLSCALCSSHMQPAVREYALSRALQLDPKCVPAWVALARLYAGGGHQGHVGWCSGSWVTEAELVCKRSPPLPLNSFLSLLLRSRHAYLFHHS